MVVQSLYLFIYFFNYFNYYANWIIPGTREEFTVQVVTNSLSKMTNKSAAMPMTKHPSLLRLLPRRWSLVSSGPRTLSTKGKFISKTDFFIWIHQKFLFFMCFLFLINLYLFIFLFYKCTIEF